MKVIALRKLFLEPLGEQKEGEPPEEPKELDYAKEIVNLVKIRASGMDFDQMEKSIRIISVVRSSKHEVVLEDADYEYLMGRFAEARWQIADPAIVRFVLDVRGAVTMTPQEMAERVNSNGHELQRAD